MADLFRRAGFSVREMDDGGLEVHVHLFETEQWVRLDEFEARDLAAALDSWRVGRPIPVGPRERP